MSAIIQNGSNIFGTSMPTVYVDGVGYKLPIADENGRKENFEQEYKEWVDLYGTLHRKTLGYRLKAEYKFKALTSDEFQDFLNIYNSVDTIDLRIKFSTIPRMYRISVDKFDHSLGVGQVYHDSLTISFNGIDRLKEFPNPDLFYTIPPILGRGVIVRTFEERGIGTTQATF